MIGQVYVACGITEPGCVFFAEGLQATTRPHPFFRTRDSGLLQMLQHCLGSGEGQGYHLFFGMKNIETGRQQGLQLLNGEIVPARAQSVGVFRACLWRRRC